MDLNHAQHVLTNFGSVLERYRAELPFGLPEALLPHPKAEIADAIRTIYVINPDPRVELQLENSLLFLASFGPDATTVSDLSAPGAAERMQRVTLASQAAMSEVHALRRSKGAPSAGQGPATPVQPPAPAAPAAAPIRLKADVGAELEGIRAFLLKMAPRLEARQPGITAQLQAADLRQPLMMAGKSGELLTVIFEPQGATTTIKVEARPPARPLGKLRAGFWRWSRRTAMKLFLKRAKNALEKQAPVTKVTSDGVIEPEVLPPER